MVKFSLVTSVVEFSVVGASVVEVSLVVACVVEVSVVGISVVEVLQREHCSVSTPTPGHGVWLSTSRQNPVRVLVVTLALLQLHSDHADQAADGSTKKTCKTRERCVTIYV